MIKAKELNKSQGFTIVELLVVVAIIAILSGLVLSSLNNMGIRSKARDSQRKADLKKIQTALELYYADNRSYPNIGPLKIQKVGGLATSLANYLSVMPVDPVDNGSQTNGCSVPTSYRYNYHRIDSNVSPGAEAYVLTAMMEVATSNDDSPCTSHLLYTQSSPNGACGVAASNPIGEYCYAAVSP